jgi:hypothetical protein
VQVGADPALPADLGGFRGDRGGVGLVAGAGCPHERRVDAGEQAGVGVGVDRHHRVDEGGRQRAQQVR